MVAFLFFVTACSSTEDPDTSAGTASTASGDANSETETDGHTSAPTSQVPLELGTGVTEDSITIGYTYLNLDDLREAGLIDLNHGPIDEHLQTMVDHINSSGGVNGRSLEVLTTSFDPIDQTTQAAICIELTEDNEIFAVLGAVRADEVLCYTESHDTVAIVQTGMTAERLARSNAPYATVDQSAERNIEAFITAATERGLFEDKTVAVHAADAETIAQEIAVPALEAAGIDVVFESYPANDGSVEGVEASTEINVEAMRARGVDAVVVVGDAIVATRSFLADDFVPALFLTERGSAAAAAVNNDLTPFGEVLTFGGLNDVDRFEEQTFLDECAAVWNAAHPDDPVKHPNEVPEGEPNHVVGLGNVCRTLTIFVTAAEAAGDNLNNTTFKAALDNLGEFSLPGLGAASLRTGKYDALDDLRLWIYDPARAESDNGFLEVE
jgi:hypothetical protein